MKFKLSKKVIISILIILVFTLVVNTSIIHAETNSNYGPSPVSDDTLEGAMQKSSLLEAIAKLVYAVANLAEWLLGIIFSKITGTSDFPWADKIVFNAVPLLDVNFINPNSKSFFSGEMKNIISNIYATVFSIAVSFFGIAVMIAAIKLVVSTIASEKAKYKQAIVDWLFGLIMLFCIHYFISFVFYFNEQLVIIASDMVTTQLKDKNDLAGVKMTELANKLVESAKGKKTVYGTDVSEVLKKYPSIVNKWLTLDASDNSKGIQEAIMKKKFLGWDIAISDERQLILLGTIVEWVAEHSPSYDVMKEQKDKVRFFYSQVITHGRTDKREYAGQIILEKDLYTFFAGSNWRNSNSRGRHAIIAAMYDKFDPNDTASYGFNKIPSTECGIFNQNLNYNELPANVYERDATSKDVNITNQYVGKGIFKSAGVKSFVKFDIGVVLQPGTTFYMYNVLNDLLSLKASAPTDTGGKGVSTSLIPDLASYFKFFAYDKDLRDTNKTGVKSTGNIQIENMLMYAILVAQSLILFISYVKRLFYVVVIAMMGPIVVVIDFIQKIGK